MRGEQLVPVEPLRCLHERSSRALMLTRPSSTPRCSCSASGPRRSSPGSPHECHRAAGGRDLLAAGWTAPGHRAGRGPHPALSTSRAADPAGAAAAGTDRGSAGSARAPADAAQHDCVELRPADEEEQTCFRRLAVFAGGRATMPSRRWPSRRESWMSSPTWPPWSTKAWCASAKRGRSRRFTMLETIREFGLERAQSRWGRTGSPGSGIRSISWH